MTIAVYAGTFDPVTAGHLSVVRAAAGLFEHLVVVIAVNPAKTTLFTGEERMALLRDAVAAHPNVRVASTSGYVVELARSIGARVLVRGIRGATDAAFETTLAQENRKLAPEIETVFVPALAGLSDVSSSGLKELARASADLSIHCSPAVAEALRAKLALRKEST